MIFLLWIYNNVQHVVWTLFLVRIFLSKKISIFFDSNFFSKPKILEILVSPKINHLFFLIEIIL